ncbi:actin cross-linking domain-containing toxin [Kribbella sp. NPDC059898]|uniref:actin cross-linking domain-containing toxin n=1 Tax=Kribbella sp. NPDC059898 TaxID=3346995 RepID=UPI003655114B
MPRPSDWDAIGLGGDPTPGEPETIGQLAEVLQKLGGKARDIFNAIQSVMNTNNDSVFVGQAADALRGKVDDRLRGHVEDVANAFETSAQALRDWRGVVEEQQRKADAALAAGRGLKEDDPERDAQKGIAQQAGRDQSDQASTYAGKINGVSDIQLPISSCEAFWEAFKWLAIILIIPALIFGGPIALLALGVNLALFIKTIVDVANGDASFLDLFLAGLGLIAPTTKALPIFSIIKGIAKGISAGAKGLASSFRTIFSKDFLFKMMTGLKGMPMLVTLSIRETGLFVASNIRNFAVSVGNFGANFGSITLGALGKFGTAFTQLPATIVRGFSAVGRGLGTVWNGGKQFISAHFGGLQWTRLFLPVAADEIRAFKALGMTDFQAFTQALKVGVFGRGLAGQHVFGLPMVSALGHTISAVPINTPKLTFLENTKVFFQEMIAPPPLKPDVKINQFGFATESGITAGKAFEDLHLPPMNTNLGHGVNLETVVTPGGVHVPSTAGTNLTNIPSANIGQPAVNSIHGVNGVTGNVQIPTTSTSLTHLNGGMNVTPPVTNIGSLHVSTPQSTSIGDLVNSGLRNNTTTSISPHITTSINEGVSHGFQANHLRLSLDELTRPPAPAATNGGHVVSPPAVERVNAALDLVTGGPADLKMVSPANLRTETPTFTGVQNVATPPTAHVQPVNVPKTDVPPQQQVAPHTFSPGRSEIPLNGLPDHPGIVVKVERFEGGVTQFNLHGGGPNGRLDPLNGGGLRFTDTSTGVTTRFDPNGVVVDHGVRLTKADGLARIDDRVLIKQPDGGFRITNLDGSAIPDQVTIRALDTGGVHVLGKDGMSWHYTANGKLENQSLNAAWNSDLAAKAGVFRKPGDTDAAVNAKLDDFTRVQQAQNNLHIAQENVAIHGDRVDGPSNAPSVGDQVHLDLHGAQHDLDLAKNAFEGKHGIGVDGLQQQLDDLTKESLSVRPRLLGGARTMTYDVPGHAGLKFDVNGAQVHVHGPGADDFTSTVVGKTLTISDGSHTWTYSLGFGGRANHVGESFALHGGHFDGRPVSLEGKLGNLDSGVADGKYSVKVTEDGLVVASPHGPLRYGRDGSFHGIGTTATDDLVRPVPPPHLAGDDLARWNAQVDLSRTHLTEAAGNKAVENLMKDVMGGSFTSKRGFGGYVNPSSLADGTLVAKVKNFDTVARELQFKGAADHITVYRGVSMDPLSAQADEFVERLPISTSSTLKFQDEWAKNGVDSNRVVFKVDVPPNHGKLAMSYPEGYHPGGGEARAWNQDQWEITLGPATFTRTGPDIVENGHRIIPVKAEPIPASKFDEVITAKWPGISSESAFGDFVKSFETPGLRGFEGLEDVTTRATTSVDGLSHTVHVGKPGSVDELTISVLRNPQDDSVRVIWTADGANKFDKTWSGQQFSNLATDLRGNVLHNNDAFMSMPKPASWDQVPGKGTGIAKAWDDDFAARFEVFRSPGETDAAVGAKMDDFVNVERAQAQVDAAIHDVRLYGHRADGPSDGPPVGAKKFINLWKAQENLNQAKTAFETKHPGMSVADIQTQLRTLLDQSLKDRPRLVGGMTGRTTPDLEDITPTTPITHTTPTPQPTAHAAPPPPPPPLAGQLVPPPPPHLGSGHAPVPPPPPGVGGAGHGAPLPVRPQRVVAPEFGKKFDSASFGTESELGGFVVAMPEGSHRVFAFVKNVETDESLVMVTKDMSTGIYRNPGDLPTARGGNWTTHTVELVNYPSRVGDQAGIALRDDATQFLLDTFKSRLNTANHQAMESITSPDGRFRLEITNGRHAIGGGSGMQLDDLGSVTMPLGGQQLTVGVKATEFATTDELKLLRENPWYNPEFRTDDAVRNLDHATLDNPAAVESAYTYLKSIITFTAKQVDKHGIPIGAHPGASPFHSLTDPVVKNDWAVLPRTRPNVVLEGLSDVDRAATLKLLRELPEIGDGTIWRESKLYILGGGEVAGHGINDAVIGGEKALLFEFRAVPDGLKHLVPTQKLPTASITDLLADLGPGRRAAVQHINGAVGHTDNRGDFAGWFREKFPDHATKTDQRIVTMSTVQQKAEWMMTRYPHAWDQVLGGQEPVIVRTVQLPQIQQHPLGGAFGNHVVIRPEGGTPHVTGPNAHNLTLDDFGDNGFRLTGPDGRTQLYDGNGVLRGDGIRLDHPQGNHFTENFPGGTRLVDQHGVPIPNTHLREMPDGRFVLTDGRHGIGFGADGKQLDVRLQIGGGQFGDQWIVRPLEGRPHVAGSNELRVSDLPDGRFRVLGPQGRTARYGADGGHLGDGVVLRDPFNPQGNLFTEPNGTGGVHATDLHGTPVPNTQVERLGNGHFRVSDNAFGDVRWFDQTGIHRGSGIQVADPAHAGQTFLYRAHGMDPVLVDNAGAQLPGRLTTLEGGGFRVVEANGIARTFDDAGTYLDRQIPLGNQQVVVHDVNHNLTLHDPAGAGRTVEHIQGGGYRVVDGGNYRAYDPDGGFQANGHAVNLPGEHGFLEITPTGARRLDANYQPIPGRTVTFDAAAGEITVTRTGGFDVFDLNGAVVREVTDLDGHALGAGLTRVTRDQNGAVTWTDRNGVPVPTPHRVTVDAQGGVRLEINVRGPRNGEFHVFSREGTLTEQGFPVVRNGQATEFTYVVNRTDNTWRRVDGANVDGTGGFQHGKVDVVGLGNGRIRLQSSTAKEVDVFERRFLPDGTILDSFRKTDTLGYGRFDRRTTWATYDANGVLTNWGKRHVDTAGNSWRDYDHHGNVVRDYQQGLQKYANPIAEELGPLGKAEKEITGHVLAIKAGRQWTWNRYDADGLRIGSGDRTLETIGEGWTDTVRVLDNGNEVTRVAQQKWGTWHGPDKARQYQEFKLEPGATHPTRSGEFEVQSPQLKSVGKGELLDGGVLLQTVRQGDQRPPIWVRQNFLDNPPTAGSVAHISGDNRFQIFRWETDGADAGRGVRYVGTDESVVDVNVNGDFVRSKGKLHDGTELKVGDHATPPANQYLNATTPWKAGDQSGWRVFDNTNGWRDYAELDGHGWTVVRESRPGGVVREFQQPGTDRNIWVDRDAHGNLVGISHQTPAPVGGNHRYVVATGAADSSHWRWQELDHTGVPIAGREGDRFHFKGSSDESISWDNSFRDFDAAGNLIRDRHMLDERRFVESWQDGNQWRVAEFDKTGVEVVGSTRLDRQWRAADGTWQQNWTPGSQHFRDSLPQNGQVPPQLLRETPPHIGGDRPIRVREFKLDNGQTDLRQWKEFDFDKVVRERVASGNNFLETDKVHGQWKLYDQAGAVIGERSDNGLVFEMVDGRLTLTGNEFDFRGAMTEYRGWSTRIGDAQRQPWLMQSDWTLANKTLTPGGNPFREANYAPFSRLLTQKVMLQVGTEFFLDYAASLMIAGIVAEAQNKPFTGNDALKALMNAAVGATLKSVAGAALTETKLGGSLRNLKQSMSNVDGGKFVTKRLNNNDATWGVEWAGNTSSLRWRGGTFDYSLNMLLLPITGFVNGAMNAAIFGVPNADGKTVKLSGWQAVGEGGIAVLTGYAIANSAGLAKLLGGNFAVGRFYQKGGLAEIVLTMPFRLFEKGIGGAFLTPAIRASINPVWYQVPPDLGGTP